MFSDETSKVNGCFFLHAATVSAEKNRIPFVRQQTQLYYADKGVVFTADLVILATHSTKRLALFVDVLPHMELQGLREVKCGSLSSQGDQPQQCVNTDMSRQLLCVISKGGTDRGRGFLLGLGVVYGFMLEYDRDFMKLNWPDLLFILLSVALVDGLSFIDLLQLMCNTAT